MNFKKTIFISILLLVLSMAVVSASDLDNNYVTESDDSLVVENSIGESSEMQNSEILTASEGTFDDLQAEINFAPEGSVLNLTRDYKTDKESPIHINKNLTIDGQGHTIDCYRISQAFISEKGTISLKNLNIINGYVNSWRSVAYGGAIYVEGTTLLTIENCTFKDNWADDWGGAIYVKTNQGLIIKNSTFQDNEANDYYGGAVYIGSGNLTIYNSIFENNLACGGGGAIFHSYDGIYINGCLFRLNKAEKRSLNNQAFGGAIVSRTSKDFYIINSTFVDNYADSDNSANAQGGAIYIDSGRNLTNLYIDVNCSSSSTFINNHVNYENGGAIYAVSCSVFAENTIFSSNYAHVDGGAVYSGRDVNVKNCLFDSNNVEGAWSQCHGGAIYANGDVTVDNSTFKDNHAEDYGGAIYGKNVFVNRNEDIGEFSSFFINNKADDDNGGAICADDGSVTVVNAVLSGNSAKVDGGAVYAGYDVNVKNCVFNSNKADGASSQCYGGAIRAKNDVTVDNCTFKDNYAHDYGGAIYGENVFVNRNEDIGEFSSFFINNKADDDKGGAIYADDASVTIVNAVLSGNSAKVDGGAVYAGYDVNVKHCLFDSNRVEGAKSQCYGGAIRAKNDVTVDNCTFKDNYAYDYGGAIYGKNVFVNRNEDIGEFSSFFINNKADDDNGGAVYADDGSVTVVNAVLSGNSAKFDGGAVYAGYDVNVKHCLFDSNKVDGYGDSSQCYGGAIYGSNDVTVDNSTFKDNYVHDYGGAIYGNNIYVNNNQGSNEAFNSFFIGNNAGDNDGGALYSYCDTHAKNAVFTGNSAYEDGGAIFCCDNAYITHCLFDSNKADGAKLAQSEGGAIHCKDDLTVENSTFNKNYAFDYGGAIYADTLALRGYSYFDSNTAYDNCGGAIWVNTFREDVKFATFTNNKAGEGDNDDGGAIYIDDSNSLTFSQCVFVNNHCNDEGGAIYLDSYSSHLTLSNNIFVSNSAGKKGQVVYNYGKYDSINENWWGGKNPSSDNDELIEWKLFSDDHHSDSNPLKLTLKLTPESCSVYDSVSAIVSFNHNDGSNCSNKMRTEYISFIPTENITFNNRTDHESYVDTLLTPQKLGSYVITANLFGQLISKTLNVAMFDNDNSNNPDIFDNSGSAMSNNVFVRNVFDGNSLVGSAFIGNVLDNNQTGNNTSNVNNASTVNNQSNSNAPVKSVSQSGNSNNLIYWALALVIIALCAIIVWRKMKN